MSELMESKWQAIITTAVLLWLGWLSVMVVGMSAKIETQAIQHNNVIPPVIESSLSELRIKTNTQTDFLTRISEATISNAKDLTYATDQRNQMQQRLVALEVRLVALEKGH